MKKLFKIMTVGWATVTCCVGLYPAAVSAQDSGQGGEERKTVITADRLTFDYQNRYAFFEKNVVVVDADLHMTADTLRVLFGEDNKAQVIRAEGHVVITQEDKVARAGLAIYDVVGGKIVLRVNPVVKQDKDELRGDVITYWRDKNLMICEPGARLIIYPKSGEDKKLLLGE